jgi:hypothetical protein
LTNVSEELTVSIISTLMMEAVSTSETPVNIFHTTQRNIPEDSYLQGNVCLSIVYLYGLFIYTKRTE